MSSYVPPGKRKKETRRKALVIPMIGNKYIVARNRKSKNITFIGGGCKNAQNNKKCALQELHEEARHSITATNKNLIKFFNFVAEPKYRLLNGYNNKGQQISTDYKVFSLKPTKSFKNIYNNFHAFVPKTKSENEMSNIMLMSLNNLKNNKVYTVMKNKVLPRLKEQKSRW